MRQHRATWTTGAGRREVDVVVQRPLPRRPRTPTATSSWRSPPTSPAALAGGAPVAADGALHERGQLAAAQPSPRRPGEMLRNSLPHVARGADAVLFFQWRRLAGRRGEVPLGAAAARRHRHPGLARGRASSARPSTRLGEVGRQRRAATTSPSCSTGRRGGRCELDSHPSIDVRYLRPGRTPSTAPCRPPGVGVDVVHPTTDLSRLPAGRRARRSTSSPTPTAARLARGRRGRGTVLVTYFSGIVDEHDHVRLGGYPGRVPRAARRPRRGVPPAARAASSVHGSATASVRRRLDRATCTWPAPRRSRRTSTARRRASRPSPATTSARAPPGTSPRASTRRHRPRWSARLVAEAGVEPRRPAPPPGVEVTRRVGDGRVAGSSSSTTATTPPRSPCTASTWSPAATVAGDLRRAPPAASPSCGRR